MSRLERCTCVMGPLMVAIIAVASFAELTLADLRSDVVLRAIAAAFPGVF